MTSPEDWHAKAGKAPDDVAVDDTCAMGVDALDFLTRTRERLGVVPTSSTTVEGGPA